MFTKKLISGENSPLYGLNEGKGEGTGRRREQIRKERGTQTAYSTLRHTGTRVMVEYKEDKVYDHWESAKKGKREREGMWSL